MRPQTTGINPEHTRSDISGSKTREARKHLVLHYHLFKNAGTSVDTVLRENFGKQWAEQEFPVSRDMEGQSNSPAVTRFLVEHPELSALSSHTALMPVPSIAGLDIQPIIFVRHPMDRLRSAYAFERKQDADTFGARLAKEEDMAGYLRILLDRTGSRVTRNFQTFRLAYYQDASAGTEIERARRAIERLPFVGLVEAFERSLDALSSLLRTRFPGFSTNSYRKNITQVEGSTLASRLSDMRAEIGNDFYARLIDANADDMELFETIAARYRFQPPPR